MALKDKIKKHPIVTALVGGLIALTAVTSSKESVHFVGGSTTLHNPQGNHYMLGVVPSVNIAGDAEGNFYTFGLFGVKYNLTDSVIFKGKLGAYGPIIVNIGADNGAQIYGDIEAMGLFCFDPFYQLGLGTNSRYNLDTIVNNPK